MNDPLNINADACYRNAEQEATAYFQSLTVNLHHKKYRTLLRKDIQIWKRDHISFLSSFTYKTKPGHHPYHQYIQWLHEKGKLDRYLKRSISYIFMRDLGKDLSLKETQVQIEREVNRIKEKITRESPEVFHTGYLYRKAQQEGIEGSFIWLVKKLQTVSALIPKKMDADESKRKLIKIIAGVIMHQADEWSDETPAAVRREKLDQAIRLGYAYGLTYPFVDDLLDSGVLSEEEQEKFSNMLRSALLTGKVPELGTWTGENKQLLEHIYKELSEAFKYIRSQLHEAWEQQFFEQAYVFFRSQEVDRKKNLDNPSYTNEEIYIPVILKSASSRLIARSVIRPPNDEGFQNRTFYYGIYNQLADDFTDLFSDLKNDAVTPYTYYIKYHKKRPDLINPFELYWTVIAHLIHEVYHSDDEVREVILSRAINGLKRFKQRVGIRQYKEVMNLLTSFDPKLNQFIQKVVFRANDVEFYDKLLRDHILSRLKIEREEKKDFLKTVQDVRQRVNQLLNLPEETEPDMIEEPITEAANYSLENGGKRLRPILAWLVGVYEHRLDYSTLEPIVKSLEYMHTASLIFDDLPSQDDASIRRGRPTLHEVYNAAIAELTGLYLTQMATVEQASIEQVNSEAVLQLIRYSAKVTAAMCRGQAMDLVSKGKQLSLKQLNTLCFYKTGLAFEASLLMPGIIAGKNEIELKDWKTFAYHAGIAFQIKDDLLDARGNPVKLGKPVGQDRDNKSSTFVTVLGVEEAEKMMWDHYCSALELLEGMSLQTNLLKHYLDYMIHRDH